MELMVVLLLFSLIVSLSYYAYKVMLNEYYSCARKVDLLKSFVSPINKFENNFNKCKIAYTDLEGHLILDMDTTKNEYVFDNNLLLYQKENGSDTICQDVISFSLGYLDETDRNGIKYIKSIEMHTLKENMKFDIYMNKNYNRDFIIQLQINERTKYF